MRLILHTKGFFYYAFTTNVYWPFWNSHKGSPPKNNGHSFDPNRFTGNLDRRREGTSGYCACFLLTRAQCMCGEGGQTPTVFILFSCNQTPENHSLHFYWCGTGGSVSARLWERAQDTSCWNRCAGFSFRAFQRGVGLISDHISLFKRARRAKASADLIVPIFLETRYFKEPCFKPPF